MSSNIAGNGIGSIMLTLSTGPLFFAGAGVIMLIVAAGHTQMIVPESKGPMVHKTVM